MSVDTRCVGTARYSRSRRPPASLPSTSFPGREALDLRRAGGAPHSQPARRAGVRPRLRPLPRINPAPSLSPRHLAQAKKLRDKTGTVLPSGAPQGQGTVSYTHLTLPTIHSV